MFSPILPVLQPSTMDQQLRTGPYKTFAKRHQTIDYKESCQPSSAPWQPRGAFDKMSYLVVSTMSCCLLSFSIGTFFSKLWRHK